MTRQWDPDVGAFRCHYSAVPLDGPPGTRRYATWKHLTPGVESDVVLVADLVNRMKTDMSDAQFRVPVNALARHFDGASFDFSAFPADPT
jgi:hypothetical protein